MSGINTHTDNETHHQGFRVLVLALLLLSVSSNVRGSVQLGLLQTVVAN
jgi:hypothetical protein